MLHEVAGGFHHARHQILVGRQLVGLPHFPLMCMPGIRTFQKERHGLGLHDDRKNLRQGDIVRVRAFVISPAHVHAHAIRGTVRQSVIQRFHLNLGILEKRRLVQILEARVPSHRQIRTIQLQ